MAVVHHHTDVDLHLNVLLRARFETVAVLPPASPANAGLVVRYAVDGLLYASTGTGWAAATSAPSGFVHTQLVPQAVVTVTHSLGYRPAVSMFSLDFSVQYDEFGTEHLDTDTVRVSMDTPYACALVMS
jgi:hypothetical protein